MNTQITNLTIAIRLQLLHLLFYEIIIIKKAKFILEYIHNFECFRLVDIVMQCTSEY